MAGEASLIFSFNCLLFISNHDNLFYFFHVQNQDINQSTDQFVYSRRGQSQGCGYTWLHVVTSPDLRPFGAFGRWNAPRVIWKWRERLRIAGTLNPRLAVTGRGMRIAEAIPLNQFQIWIILRTRISKPRFESSPLLNKTRYRCGTFLIRSLLRLLLRTLNPNKMSPSPGAGHGTLPLPWHSPSASPPPLISFRAMK